MRIAIRWILAAALLLPVSANAEPITLKLSFFTSARTVAYQTAIKPFVDAINSEGRGLLEIDVYFSGALGKVRKELPQDARCGSAGGGRAKLHVVSSSPNG